MTLEDYKNISDTIPKLPGVYRFIDAKDVIIYVGKAKKLKNRVSSYFGDKKGMAYKTRTMVRNAARLEFTVVESEADALLLENTLIKKLQPRYNVQLKDAKSYTYLCVKNERFPRVFFTRKVIKDGSKYYGPYTSKRKMKQIFDLVKSLFQLRTCSFNLTDQNIAAGKFKVCLEFHINNCKGACEGLETEDEYMKTIAQVRNILNGNFKPVKDFIRSEMARYSENLQFEKAEMMKEKMSLFETYQAKSTVVSQTIKDVDVFSINTDDDLAYVNYLKVVNGVLINTDTVELKQNLDTDQVDILNYIIPELRSQYNSIAPEVVVPLHVSLTEEGVSVLIPKRGDKRRLLELSEKNLKFYILQKKKDEATKVKKQTPAQRILSTLQKDLNMSEMPLHIECFDNSNIQGTNPTASCVVFKNARPSKKDYRKFNIKTVKGANDFASMEEIVLRRYSRLLKENQPLPQLVIIDGGKGQLHAAMNSIEKLGIAKNLTVIGIAKRLEEIYFPEDPIPIYINKKSESLKLIQQARNEAHRFAINFHRDKRSKEFIQNSLESIDGIGEKTAFKLLKHFKSVKRIQQATIEDIAAVIGNQKAKLVFEAIQTNL